MEHATEPKRADVPRWSLWLLTFACFGPLLYTWLLGLLFLPLWVAMIAARNAEPERFAYDSATVWNVVWPIGCVVGGLVGLIGLVRVLTVSRKQRPRTHRVYTLAMVAIGVAALIAFSWPPGIDVGTLVYVLLPLLGTAWVLFASRKYLLAARRFSDPDLRHVAEPRA